MTTEETKKRLEEAANIEAIKDTTKGRQREDYFILAMADHENGFREGFLQVQNTATKKQSHRQRSG